MPKLVLVKARKWSYPFHMYGGNAWIERKGRKGPGGNGQTA